MLPLLVLKGLEIGIGMLVNGNLILADCPPSCQNGLLLSVSTPRACSRAPWEGFTANSGIFLGDVSYD